MWAVDGQTKRPYMGEVWIILGTFYPYPSHVKSFSLTLHHPTWKKLEVYTLIHNFQNTVFREPQNVMLTYMVVRTAYMQNIK